MLIYMIRHGQTDWNAEGRLQGQKDIPLNALGQRQARQNGVRLAELIGGAEDYDFVASPLWRARETMERLRSAMDRDPAGYRTDERLKELSFGDWEGLTLAEISRADPERAEARMRGKWSFIPPGEAAESYEILSWRIGAWLQSVEGPTICVAHGGVIRSLFRLIGNLAEDDAATAHIPQDRILRFDTGPGRLEWL